MIVAQSLKQALGAVVYVALVSLIMNNAERIFGSQEDTMITVMAFLLLFSTSAAVMGSLIFGKSVMLYLDGQKIDAVKLLVATIGWLIAITATILLIVGLR